MSPPVDGQVLSGVLVRRNFNYHLMRADDLSGTFFFPSFFSNSMSKNQFCFKTNTASIIPFLLASGFSTFWK